MDVSGRTAGEPEARRSPRGDEPLAGYVLVRRIYEGAQTVVWRGMHLATRTQVILKVAAADPPPPAILARFRHEHRLASSLDVDGVIRVLALEKLGAGLALVEEDFGGVSLREVLAPGPLDTRRFLEIAVRVAGILARIHARDVVHKDLNPKNILVNRTTGVVKVIDFGLATRAAGQLDPAAAHAGFEGTPAYASPEQTGRMNRPVDHRTDLYSIGVTFFEMLAGHVPFRATDRAELVHCHLARRPPDVADVVPGIPKAVSDIVAKLLAKSADDRYQTAAGLEADLARCLDAVRATGTVDEFPLAAGDCGDRFQVSRRLYGRDEQVAALEAAFSRTAQGYKEIVLVAGFAGIGKTSLVRELCRTVNSQGGRFVAGKFDQFKRDVPYGALVEAFQGLVRELLGADEDEVARWREDLQTALQPNGRVVTDLIPEVERLIGPQPPVPELPPTESRNRLNLTFRYFLSVFARKEHPLVLFLDDLQWADSASIEFLGTILKGPESLYLLAIGAWRDNEVDPSHALHVTLKEVRAAGTPVYDLSLPPLAVGHVCGLLADTLRCAPDRARPLAELLHAKTGGNPFFIGEVLRVAHARGLVAFSPASRAWTWDLAGIRSLDSADSVADLMVARISAMRPATQRALQLASVVGNRFDVQTLALASGRSAAEVIGDLRDAVGEGLVLPAGDAYRFVDLDARDLSDGTFDPAQLAAIRYGFAHDKIQQAACSMLPERAAKQLHRQIGLVLLRSIPPAELDQRIFDVVNPLDEAMDLVESDAESERLATLNLRAGRRARSSAAYQAATRYFETGLDLLGPDAWARSYELARDLHTGAAEAARLVSRLDAMDRHVREVLEHATSVEDQVPAYETRIDGFIAQARKTEAIETGLEVIRRLGVGIAPRPTMAHVLFQLARTELALAGRSTEDLLDRPAMTAPNILTAMRLMTRLASTAYVVSPNLFPVLVCKQVELSARHGNAPVSPFCYALYGTILCGVLHRIPRGYRYGRLAMRLQERLPEAGALVPRSSFTYIATVQHFREPLADTLKPFRDAGKLSLELGDFEFAGCNGGALIYHLFYSGATLPEIEPEVAGYVSVLDQVRQEAYLSYARLYLEAIRELMARSPSSPSLSGPSFDAATMLAHYRERSDAHGTFNVLLVRGILSYLFGKPSEAVEHLREARAHVFGAAAMFPSLVFRFYDSLARLAACDGAPLAEKRRLLGAVAANRFHLSRWARHCPTTHGHKWELVRAERARVKGDEAAAMRAYDAAIDGARRNGFVQEEALACERAALFWKATGKSRIARTYMTDALRAWDRWGAAARVAWMEREHADLLDRPSLGDASRLDAGATSDSSSPGGGGAGLDLVAVLKASQVMSGEIRLNRLLERMMTIVVENAGAQRGLLILESDGKLHLEAEASPDGTVTVMQHVPVREIVDAAQSVLNYVMRAGEPVVLPDASGEGAHTRDPYVVRTRARSILCLPLARQGRIAGLLYLENHLAPGVFSSGRVEVLETLASEMVISLENARLYRRLEEHSLSLERTVRERTRELRDANELLAVEKRKSEDLLLNVLPAKVAAQLRESGRAEPESFEGVTVCFADLVDFTRQSEGMEPRVVVEELNDLFGAFDNIVASHGCERIKTIGDAYLAVCGMPEAAPDHADRILDAALEMVRHLEARNRTSPIRWRLRIGVHSGRVVGGVVGVRKYIYDVFGDTINTASRMEAASDPMRINVSEATRALVRDRYRFEERPPVEVKGKGPMRMFWLSGA
jgi:predicted ATPase/class 3 adenylate cyclase